MSGVVVVALTLALGSSAPGTEVAPHHAPRCSGDRATIVGSNHRDVLIGTPRDDVIVARAGADEVHARHGDDLICGGRGRDLLLGNGGRDRFDGGGGSDTCRYTVREAPLVVSCDPIHF